MTAPPLLLTVLIAQPRAPSPLPDPLPVPLSGTNEDGQTIGQGGKRRASIVELHQGPEGVVELGVGKVDVKGDWRKVVGRKSLGFLD